MVGRTSISARVVSLAVIVMFLMTGIGQGTRPALADAPVAEVSSQSSQERAGDAVFGPSAALAWAGLGGSSLRPQIMRAQECVPAGDESAPADTPVCEDSVDEPVFEEPVVEEPVVEEPIVEEPVVEEPVVEEPTTEDPVGEEPTVEVPVTEEPTVEVPTEEPTTEVPSEEPTQDPEAPVAEPTVEPTVEEEPPTGAQALEEDGEFTAQGTADFGVFTLINDPSPNQAIPGDSISFTVTLTHDDDGGISGLFLENMSPPGLWSVEELSNASCDAPSGGFFTCAVSDGELGSGESLVYSLSRTAEEADCGTTLTNIVELWQSTDDEGTPEPPALLGSEADSIDVICPDLSVSKTGNGPLNAGETASYTIVLSPGGTNPSSNVTLTDNLPAGIAWSITSIVGGTYDGPPCAITSGTLTCNFGNLSPGQTRTVVVSGATDAADCGTLSNTAVGGATIDVNSGNNSSTATIDVRCPDVTVSKSTSTGTVDSGDPVSFTVTVSNTGLGAATGVTLSDQLPNPWMNWAVNPAVSGCSVDGSGLLSCTFASLAASTSQAVTVTALAPDDECGPITNDAATVSAANEPSSATGNNTSGTSTIDIQCPSLTITKGPGSEDDGAVISAGQSATFTIVVGNDGPGLATNVIVVDSLPDEETWDVTTNPAGACPATASGTLECELGDLPDGEEVTIFVNRLTTTADCGAPLLNSAFADADNLDDDDSSFSTQATPEAEAEITVLCPNLAVAKSAAAANVDAGQNAEYTITVSNGDGDNGTAFDVTLTDELPNGVDWGIDSIAPGLDDESQTCDINPDVGETDQVLSCNFDNLDGGAQYVITISGTTDAADCTNAGGLTGTLSNTATVDSEATEPVTSTPASVITVRCPDLTVSKTTSTGTVDSGDLVNYTLTVSNGGPGGATGVTLTDVLPAETGLTWAVNPEVTGCAVTSGTLNCTFPGTLAAGANHVVTVTSTVPDDFCGTLSNNGATVSATNEAATGNNTQTIASDITVRCPELTVAKSAVAGTINSTENAEFEIDVENLGPGVAVDVELTDTLPAGDWTVTQPPGWSCEDGDAVGGAGGPITLVAKGSFTCTIDELEPTGDSPVTIQVERATELDECTTLTNDVALSAANNDEVTSSAGVVVQCPALSVEKTPDGADVDAGDTATFTITVSNAGPGVAMDVTIADTLPAGNWTVTTAPTAGLCPATAIGTLDCDLGDIAEDGSVTITVSRGTLLDECAGAEGFTTTLDNAVTVAAGNDEGDSDTGSIAVNCPSLEIDIDVTPPNAVVAAGGTVEFAVTVSNNGTGTASGVSLTDTLPGATLSLVSPAGEVVAAAVPVCEIVDNELLCDFAEMAPGESQTVVFSATTSTASCGTLTNVATVTASNATDEADATVTESTTIQVVCPAGLAVTKTASVTTAAPGDVITYLYLITNTGGDTAFDVTAVDDLGTSGFVGDDVVVCAGLTIAPGTTVQCTFDVVVSDLFAGTDLTNVVTVSGTSALGGVAIASASAVATVAIVEELEPCSFPVTFIFVADIVFAMPDGTPLFTINQGSTLTFPNGNQQGGGCQSDNWSFVGTINGQSASFTFAGFLGPEASAASAGVRALPALATSDLVLEITEVNTVDWDVADLPEPEAPAVVQFTTGPTGGTIEVEGAKAEVSISPDLEVPFQSINEYEIGTTSLPDVGSGAWSIGGTTSGLPLGLMSMLPVVLLLFATRLRFGYASRPVRLSFATRRNQSPRSD